MERYTLYLSGVLVLLTGTIIAGTLEAKIRKKIQKAQQEYEEKVAKAREESRRILENVKREEDSRRKEIYKTEQILLKRENTLDQKISEYEDKEKEFKEKVEKLKKIKAGLEDLKKESLIKLEKISRLTRKEAKKELKDILEKIKRLEGQGKDQIEKKAKEILAFAIQKFALSQAQDITTSTLALPSDEIKGRIIGKEGRNIKTLEKLTGVEIVVDETPETVLISGFDPIRRQIAKISLEKLIEDGRIQPARIAD